MATRDFFRRFLPYGMKKNEKGEWFVFNRDYAPLGWPRKDEAYDEFYSDLPVRIEFSRLLDSYIESIFSESSIQRSDDYKIHSVFFYNDGTNPLNGGSWDEYFAKLKRLSTFTPK